MDSVIGQTFLNYAYSWGASVVILGTLFKLTHLPGANLMLYIGMGTEVIVFFLSAFDRPFDKTAIGMDLSTQDSHPVTEVTPPLACDMTNKKETVAHGGKPAADAGGMVFDPVPVNEEGLVFLLSARDIAGEGAEDDPAPQDVGNQQNDQVAAEKAGDQGHDDVEDDKEKGKLVGSISADHKVAQPVHALTSIQRS